MPRVASAKHVLASTANIRNICVVVLITVMLTTAIDRDICVCVCVQNHTSGRVWLGYFHAKTNTQTQLHKYAHTHREIERERERGALTDTAGQRTKQTYHPYKRVHLCAESSGDSFHFNWCANLPLQLAPWLCA